MSRATVRQLLVVCSSVIGLGAGCGGKAGVRDGDADGSVAGGGTAGAVSDPSNLKPQTESPPPEGDGRLADIGDQIAGDGWDSCGGEPWLRTTRAWPCPDCPPATRGQEFVIIQPASADAKRELPQAYFFFDAPAQADALWLDAMWINGPVDSDLSIFVTDQVCQPQSAARVFHLHELFTNVGEWVTACVPLSELAPFLGLGFRFDARGTLGVDAFRFGPACPAP